MEDIGEGKGAGKETKTGSGKNMKHEDKLSTPNRKSQN